MVCLGLPVMGISKPFFVINCIVEAGSKQVAEKIFVFIDLSIKTEAYKDIKPPYYTIKTVSTQLGQYTQLLHKRQK
jgi:hypothetical protein